MRSDLIKNSFATCSKIFLLGNTMHGGVDCEGGGGRTRT